MAGGAVFAKTRWIDTGYTLSGAHQRRASGIVHLRAIYALSGFETSSAKTAIHALTAGFYNWGFRLSNQ